MSDLLSPPTPPPPAAPLSPAPFAFGHTLVRLLAVWGLPVGLPLLALTVVAVWAGRRWRAARDRALIADANQTINNLTKPY